MLLHNTVSEIHKLYARAAREEPHHAPNIQEVQDLNSYLHLWNAHKQEKSDLICITMKGWRPPAWAAEAAKQKKLALREKGKAQAAQQKGNSLPQHGQPSTTGTQPKSSSITSPGTAPTSYPQSLQDRLISPELGEVVTRETATDQYPRQSSLTKPLPRAMGTSSAATAPPKRKGKGRSKPNDDLPTAMPPLSANADSTWVHFMHLWQLGWTRVEDDWAWNQVFPGALWGGPIDGHEVDPLPPHIRAVCGFLIVQRLMPQSQFNMGRNTWRRMAAWLFGIAGRYRSMISWAGSALVPGGNAAWFGASDGSAYTLGRLAAYFAANGVSYEDADDLWWWGQNHLEELRNRYLCSESPDVVAILSVVNADWGICNMNEAARSRSRKYYNALPAPPDGESRDVALPSSGECKSDPLLQEQMANAVELYDLMPVHSTGLQSGPMDVDTSANEGDYDDLYESPM